MRSHHVALAAITLAAIAVTASAQQRVPLAPSGTNGNAVAVSEAQAGIDRAAAAQKYAFVFFWRERTAESDRAWGAFEAAAAKLAASASVVAVQITNPAEKRLVDKYNVTRSPMPLVLAVAPNGAVTKAFTRTFDENQLRTAFVSRCTAECLKGLQNRKLVLLCIERVPPQVRQVSLQQGVQDFTTSREYAAHSTVVLLNADDPAEAGFLNDLRVAPPTNSKVTVLLSPPGSVVGTFVGNVTAAQIVAKLKAAQSGGCPGGKCGPGGCGPRK
ncbi:MAG: hypothetical protein LLG00_10780 [Planctomycetaceae bacterium]|nr:hypothetical protein [Planctomycetaceae bacterium]